MENKRSLAATGCWRRPSLWLGMLCLLSYAYFYQGGGWNQNSRFDLTRALVERHAFAIDAYVDNTGDLAARDRHFYCDKAPGLSLLAAPVYALFMQDNAAPTSAALNNAAYLSTLITVAVPSAGAVMVLFELLLIWGTRRAWATAVTLGYGLASLAWPYSTLFFGHQLMASLLLFAFALLAYKNETGIAAATTAGLCLGLAIAVEYPALLAALAIGVLAVRKGLRSTLALSLGAAPPLLLLAYYHWQAFGSPSTLPYEFSTQPDRHMGYFMGLGLPDLNVLMQITVGAYRGLFYSAPWLLFALPGALVWLRRGPRLGAGIALVIVLLFLWLNASLVDWQGGWTYGPRYLVSALPFLALLAGGVGALQWQSIFLARLVAAIAALAVFFSYGATLIATAVNPQVPMAIARPFGDYLLPQWQAGQVAVSRQGIDMKFPQRDVAPQAWNLGQLAGLSGTSSVAPLHALQILLLAGFALHLRYRSSSD